MVLHIQYHAAMAGRQVATRARITPTNRKTCQHNRTANTGNSSTAEATTKTRFQSAASLLN